MPNTSPSPWLKDVQTLASPELARLEADIKSGTLTEEAAKPLLLAAGMRAVRERLVAQGGLAPSMDSVPRRAE